MGILANFVTEKYCFFEFDWSSVFLCVCVVCCSYSLSCHIKLRDDYLESIERSNAIHLKLFLLVLMTRALCDGLSSISTSLTFVGFFFFNDQTCCLFACNRTLTIRGPQCSPYRGGLFYIDVSFPAGLYQCFLFFNYSIYQ